MAFRYLIYSTGTTYATTIVRESATNNPGVNEASLYTDFVIPEIQPLYLWRVVGLNVIPNTDANILAYEAFITPPPTAEDLATYGQVTGLTETKIDKVTGADDNIAIFDASGNVINSGYTIPELTGLTTYTFLGSGGTQVFENGNQITIYSTIPTGSSVTWGNITGNLSLQTDLWSDLVFLSGATTGLSATKLDKSVFNAYTGATQPILNSALTGLTNLGTGTTLGGVSARNVTIKSISVLGGLQILGDANNLIISGDTGGMSSVAWGQITGTLSSQTDLWNTLTGQSAQIATKLNISTFNSYTGATENRLDALEAWTGTTDSRIDAIEVWTGVTENRLDGLDIWTGATEGRLDAIEVWTGATENRLDALDIWTGITEQRLDGLDIWTGTTENRLDALDIWTGVTETRLDAIEVWTGATDSRIDSLEAWSGTTQPILDAALTGATNGLTVNGRDVELGGTLTKDTSIVGTAFGFTANTKNVLIQAINGINIVDTDGVGGVNIESDSGTIALIGNDNLSVEKTKLEISQSSMLITDSRAVPVGLQYAGSYETTFTADSLVNKRYVDAIASGLVPKASVKVTTTGANIVLSGLSTIDGIALVNGDRVLVKDQTNGAQNGIYIASANTWTRATDFDGTPTYGEVTNGNLIPVLSGSTLYNTIWVLTTPNPITVGVTSLSFSLFSSQFKPIAGHGISISGNTIAVKGTDLDSSSIGYSGGTFVVNLTAGPVKDALDAKLNVSIFNSYSGATENRLDALEIWSGTTESRLDALDVWTGATEQRLDGLDIWTGATESRLDALDVWTGATAPIINAAITGATNGLTKIGSHDVELGGALTGNVNINGLGLHELNIINIEGFSVSSSGLTAQILLDPSGMTFAFGSTSVNLDSNAGLTYSADYSANYTPRSLVDAAYVTGKTSSLQSQINYISGVTDTKLDIDVFTGYTATTKNKDKKIQLVSTGTTDVNTVAATPILWNSANPYATDIYSYTGGSSGVKVLLSGTYEIQYHITLKNSAANQTHSVGGYLILNNLSTIPITATAAMVIGPNNSGELSLPPVVLSLNANDELDLAAFRIGNSGTVNTVSGSVYMVINKLT